MAFGRRPTMYNVARGHEFTMDEWDKLAAVIHLLDSGFAQPEDYGYSTRSSVLERQAFSVWRNDHKPLVKAETTAMYWFFRGVMAAHGIQA